MDLLKGEVMPYDFYDRSEWNGKRVMIISKENLRLSTFEITAKRDIKNGYEFYNPRTIERLQWFYPEIKEWFENNINEGYNT